MSVFPPITGGPTETIQAVSNIELDAFFKAINELVVMSLVDKGGLINQERYALHPLTHSFILSDITKEDEWVNE